MRSAGERGQAAMLMVMGVLALMAGGDVVLVNDSTQTSPLVGNDFVAHDAYRALESGLNAYLSAVNANPNLAECNSSSTSTLCTGVVYEKWSDVPTTDTGTGALPEHYLFTNPQYVFSTGTDPALQYMQEEVWGAAGSGGAQVYESSIATFLPENGFLQNLYWTKFNAFSQTGNYSACRDDWAGGAYTGPGGACSPVYFGENDVVNGPVFTDDSIYVSGTSTQSPTFDDKVQTADPDCLFVGVLTGSPASDDCTGKSAVKAYATATSSGNAYGATAEAVPQDDSQLASLAQLGGCEYDGPTTITLAGASMTVSSPETPAAGGDATTDLPSDPTTCPVDGTVAVSSIENGVVYVANDPNAVVKGTNPFDDFADKGEYAQNTENADTKDGLDGYCPRTTEPCYYGATDSPDAEGDAFVSGTLSGQLTIGAQNDVVVDGNLTYTSDAADCGASFDSTVADPCLFNSTASGVNDSLGLVADNYVEVSHPVYLPACKSKHSCSTEDVTDPLCGASGAPAPPLCDPGPITVDGAILALNQSFLVNNYEVNPNGDTTEDSNPCSDIAADTEGTLTVYGAISQYARGPVGTLCGSTAETGYTKSYNWDARAGLVSPPSYLVPGTPSWAIGSSSVSTVGSCTKLPAPYSGGSPSLTDTCPAD